MGASSYGHTQYKDKMTERVVDNASERCGRDSYTTAECGGLLADIVANVSERCNVGAEAFSFAIFNLLLLSDSVGDWLLSFIF